MTVNLRCLLASLKNGWNNLRLAVKPYLNYGCNISLELIMICAGIVPIPGPEPWKRKCMALYRLLGFYQFVMSLAKLWFSIHNQENLVELCASFAVVLVLLSSLIRVYTLKHYREVVEQSEAFVKSKCGQSGDPDYDTSVQRDAARAAGKMTLVYFIMECCNQMPMMVPSSARDRIFGIPKQFDALGPIAFRFLQETFVFMIIIIWGSTYFCYSFTVLPLLLGLRSELMIVARGFETIQNRVQAQITKELENAVGPSQESLARVLKWKHLKQILGVTVEQHVEVLRNMQFLRNLVSILYAISYYTSMVILSIAVLLFIKSGITLVSVTIFIGASVLIVECYLWALLIESIEDIMEAIAASVAQLGSELEDSTEHHSEYVLMRTSLMIIQLNSTHQKWFSCGGVFPISVESFGDLCLIIYRGATFLLDFE